MKIHNVEQGSQEWIELRLFTPTASNFHKIITPKTMEFSKQSKPYAYLLIAQKLLNRPLESLEGLENIERGKMDEPKARKAYEFDNDCITQLVGFVTTDDGSIGCSPDSLVGDKGMVEIKCPSPQTMVKYHIEGVEDAYTCQKQGQLYVVGREWDDLYAFSYEMPKVQKRFERNEKFIDALAKALREFNDMKADMLSKMEASGYFAEKKQQMSIAEQAYQDNLEQLIGVPA